MNTIQPWSGGRGKEEWRVWVLLINTPLCLDGECGDGKGYPTSLGMGNTKWCGKAVKLLCIPAVSISKEGNKNAQEMEIPAPFAPSLLTHIAWDLKGFSQHICTSVLLEGPTLLQGWIPTAPTAPCVGSRVPVLQTQARHWQLGFNHTRADNHQMPLISNKLSNPDACRIWVNTAPNRIIKQISTKRFRVSALPSPRPGPSNGEKCKSGDPVLGFETRSVPGEPRTSPPTRHRQPIGCQGQSALLWDHIWNSPPKGKMYFLHPRSILWCTHTPFAQCVGSVGGI